MSESIRKRLQYAWNAFRDERYRRSPTYNDYGYSSSFRPDRTRLRYGTEKSIVSAIYNRIAVDGSAFIIEHVKLDQNKKYLETVSSDLNNCLTLSPNLDQAPRAFIQDAVVSLFDEGCIGIVPVDTTKDPYLTDSYDIQTLRVGKILEWYPKHVSIELYNEATGQRESVRLPKSMVAIVENPFYAVMNEPNSIAKRLINKLNLLDLIDEQVGSGKLDLLVQLPYTVKTPAKKKLAETRRKDIEMQLTGSKYGIAYIDSTERVIQLNRPVDNNLMTQIEYLTKLLYSQLSITDEIMNGTADEKTMLNYMNRTVEPVIMAIVEEMRRKFLTKTAISQGKSIMYFQNPFRFSTVSDVAEAADKLTRNEILSSNEVRSIIGYKPVNDARADELRNKNLNQEANPAAPISTRDSGENQNGSNL